MISPPSPSEWYNLKVTNYLDSYSLHLRRSLISLICWFLVHYSQLSTTQSTLLASCASNQAVFLLLIHSLQNVMLWEALFRRSGEREVMSWMLLGYWFLVPHVKLLLQPILHLPLQPLLLKQLSHLSMSCCTGFYLSPFCNLWCLLAVFHNCTTTLHLLLCPCWHRNLPSICSIQEKVDASEDWLS